MRILVIGGTRFLGRQLVWRLAAAGHDLVLFNRGQQADPFAGSPVEPRIERLRGDRTTADFEQQLRGQLFDAVVDFAAYSGSDTRRAVELFSGQIGHYVFISSGQVYLVRQDSPTPARESDYEGALLPKPSDPEDLGEWEYGIGKRDAEDMLERAWHERRFPGTRLRLPMVNGAGDYYTRIDRYLWRILDGGPLLLPDGGDTPTRHVYSGSAVRAIAGLLGDARTFGQAYNLAQDETPTLREICALLAEAVGAPLLALPMTRAALLGAGLDPVAMSPFSGRWMSFIEPARARQELGFRHEPLRSYLERIAAAFLEHPPAEPPPGYALRAAETALARQLGG